MKIWDFIKGFAVGTLAGAVVGILIAPKPGKETREDILKFGQNMGDKLSANLARIKNTAEERYDDLVRQYLNSEDYLTLNKAQKSEIKAEFKRFLQKLDEIAQE